MNKIFKNKKVIAGTALFLAFFQVVFSQTVTGGGYSVTQSINSSEGVLTGNGYRLVQSMVPTSGLFSSLGFLLSSSLPTGSSTTAVATTTPPPPLPPVTPPSPTNGGGGYYMYNPIPFVTSTTTGTTTTPYFPFATTTTPKDNTTSPESVITENGSSCPFRVVVTSPIDTILDNNKEEVKKLENFLNEYENENLPVNGIYEERDVQAVKRWQLKYKSYILDPMQLKKPTGTIYTLSMRHIERQSSARCGEAVVITSCPFFKKNVSYGDEGEDVRKVQQFLNIVQGERLPLSGVFGPLTKAAVKRFQKSRRIYVATFIPISFATGNWYTTTRTKANETIGCDIVK